MKALAVEPQPIRSLISDVLADDKLIPAINECLLASTVFLFADRLSLSQETNWIAETMRTQMAIHLHSYLTVNGFAKEVDDCQLRLLRKTKGVEAVRLRWCLGTVKRESGLATFNARKGPRTKDGIRQNAEHFSQDALFPELFRPNRTEREANLWILYSIDRRANYLSSWLAMLTESQTARMSTYDDVLDLFHGVVSPQDNDPTERQTRKRFRGSDEDYGLDFGERAA